MIRYRASWVLPIAAPPIRDGWVAIDGGRVVGVGRPGGADGLDSEPAVDLGSVVILPGLVNAHTHLELSYLRNRVPPAADFVTWIRDVVAARRRQPDPSGPEIMRGVDEGIAEAVRCGTAVVGDISNTLVTVPPLTRSPLGAVVFFELIRFRATDAETLVAEAVQQIRQLGSRSVRTTLAAHAPYSVAPSLFRAIRQAVDRERLPPCSVHLSESVDEMEFIGTGGGSWKTFLEEVGAWDPEWAPPGESPVRFLDRNGFFGGPVLAVHGVQMTRSDLSCLAARGATLVTCPRSNGHTGAGVPPVADFFESGVRIALGTDSLASTPDLNLFAELAALRGLAPAVSASRLLESATREGARALGFEADFGTIEPGKRARLLAITFPEGVGDVEEYLLSGIRPEQIAWVDGDT